MTLQQLICVTYSLLFIIGHDFSFIVVLYRPKTLPQTFWNMFYFIRHIRWLEFLWLQTVKPRCKYDMYLRDFSSSSKGQNIICGGKKRTPSNQDAVYIYISTNCLTKQQTNHIYCLTQNQWTETEDMGILDEQG